MDTNPADALEKPPEEAAAYELSVGDVMTDVYVSVDPETSIEAAVDRFQRFTPEDPAQRTIYYTYVVD